MPALGLRLVAASNDRLWGRLCGVLGLEHLTEDPRFDSNLKRGENREELEEIVAARVAEYERDRLLEALKDVGVPASPVNTLDRLMQEPQVEHRQMIQTVEHSTLGEIQLLGEPMKFSAMNSRPATAAPAYGEHTDQILREHGYSEDEVAALRDKKVVR